MDITGRDPEKEMMMYNLEVTCPEGKIDSEKEMMTYNSTCSKEIEFQKRKHEYEEKVTYFVMFFILKCYFQHFLF